MLQDRLRVEHLDGVLGPFFLFDSLFVVLMQPHSPKIKLETTMQHVPEGNVVNRSSRLADGKALQV